MASSEISTNKKPLPERTLMYEETLPKLPLPTLEATCRRYIQSVLPLVSSEELENTKRIVQRFQDGIGKVLHAKLEEKARTTDNWIRDWWDDCYTMYRGPLAVFANAGGVNGFRAECLQPKEGRQIPLASITLHHIVQCYMELVHETWPIDRFKDDSPANMEQYYYLFSSARRPELENDKLERYFVPGTAKIRTNGIRHVTVIYKNRFFNINVLSKDFKVLSQPEIARQLYKVKEMADAKPLAPAVGALTAADRVTWSKLRDHLCSLNSANEKIIDEIHKSILVLVLEEQDAVTLTEILHEATLGDCSNRWYDKGTHIIYFKTGGVCNIFEHAQFDGGAPAVFFQRVFDDIIASNAQWGGSHQIVNNEEPEELEFVVDDKILHAIKDVTLQHHKNASMYAVLDLPFLGYGKDFLKKNNFRPNSFLQAALQLAHRKRHGCCTASYETATTRKYRYARTETTRSCTADTVAFAEGMMDKKLPNAEKLKLLRTACDAHEKVYKDALNGRGIDRHLWALKLLSIEGGYPLPEIFTDAAWQKSGGDATFTLSTSMSGYNPAHGAVVPMVTDGYGVFYNIENDRMQFALSSCLLSTKTDIDSFYAAIIESLLQMQRLVMASKL